VKTCGMGVPRAADYSVGIPVPQRREDAEFLFAQGFRAKGNYAKI
jgi:hypothetical protein